MKAASGKSMAGAIKVQTRPGRGRSPESWYGGGSQVASMSAERKDALELAAATGNPAARNKRNPGEPGVTSRTGRGFRPGGVSTGGSSPSSPMARQRGTAGGARTAPGSRRGGKPGNPGVTDAAATRPKPRGNVGKNPGETVGSTHHKPQGTNVTQNSPMNQGSAAGDIPGLITLAQRFGAKTTMQHLQAAQTSLTSSNYPQAVIHLSRAHETARADGNAQLMNAIQSAHGKLRMKTP